MSFLQDGFRFNDFFQEGELYEEIIDYYAPDSPEIKKDLQKFSMRVVSDILKMSQSAERVEPQWVPYSAWGEKVDDIIMDAGMIP